MFVQLMSPNSSVFDEFAPPSIDEPPPEVVEEEPKRSKKRGKETITALELREGQSRLYRLSDLAFQTLEDAMRNADYPTATKAAQTVLDRSGFGPKSTVDVNTTHIELADLSLEELADRAERLRKLITAQQERSLPINVTPSKVA